MPAYPKPSLIPLWGNLAAWTVLTTYALGARVVANGNVYQCTVQGVSAGAGTGPAGGGGAIVDGTATWAFQAATSTVWALVTGYTVGAVVSNDGGKLYVALNSQTSGATGPTGTGGAIGDGSMLWSYTGTVLGQQTIPTSRTADAGMVPGGPIFAQYLNYIFAIITTWIWYVRDLADQTWTWTAAHVFTVLTTWDFTAGTRGPMRRTKPNGDTYFLIEEDQVDPTATLPRHRWYVNSATGEKVRTYNALWSEDDGFWVYDEPGYAATKEVFAVDTEAYYTHPDSIDEWVDTISSTTWILRSSFGANAIVSGDTFQLTALAAPTADRSLVLACYEDGPPKRYARVVVSYTTYGWALTLNADYDTGSGLWISDDSGGAAWRLVFGSDVKALALQYHAAAASWVEAAWVNAFDIDVGTLAAVFAGALTGGTGVNATTGNVTAAAGALSATNSTNGRAFLGRNGSAAGGGDSQAFGVMTASKVPLAWGKFQLSGGVYSMLRGENVVSINGATGEIQLNTVAPNLLCPKVTIWTAGITFNVTVAAGDLATIALSGNSVYVVEFGAM